MTSKSLLALGAFLATASGCKKETAKKPILYLYPEQVTQVDVRFADPDTVELTHSYPDYGRDGWSVIAHPDGTLVDPETDEAYYALYWEGLLEPAIRPSTGAVVAATDTETFLDTSLARLGLTSREANEFIVYWAPILEERPFNFVHFATDTWDDQVPLDIDPVPDTQIRVMMYYRPCSSSLEVPAQVLTAPQRTGFTVVEWGGARLATRPR